ncbi:uncharacterized protein MKZ38_008797 [Zalerion maritima]|uniref:Uncharacterized protein n=1 Tax=Zalerion maritima TaxID=339359 RepID=A0AAD5RHA6_9PEZI|nr:uncharacterized protein MKZ38_008797 [Zalerion maritima]
MVGPGGAGAAGAAAKPGLTSLIALAALFAPYYPGAGRWGAAAAAHRAPQLDPDQLDLGGGRFAAMLATPTPMPIDADGPISPRRLYPQLERRDHFPVQALVKRDDECRQDYHPCLFDMGRDTDETILGCGVGMEAKKVKAHMRVFLEWDGNDLGTIGSGFCCENTQYCVLDSDWNANCCTLGAHCIQDCEIDQVFCNTTVTTTISSTSTTFTSGSASGDATLASLSVLITTTSVLQTCCDKLCPTSTAFLCANSIGCCSYGSTCGGEEDCQGTPTSVATTAPTASPTGGYDIIPEGCSKTGEFSCDPEFGTGCCVTGQVCTTMDDKPVCSEEPSGGLSVKAKAGIGAGAAVAGGVIVAGVTWWVLGVRQKRRDEMDGQGGQAGGLEGRMVGSGIDSDEYDEDGDETVGGGGSTERRSGRGSGGRLGLGLGMAIGRRARRRSRPAMSERSRTTTTNQYSGTGNIYSGPDAVTGPYTQTGDPNSPTAAGHVHRQHGSTGLGAEAAVRVGVPHGPDDVVAPVEIDGRVKEDETERHPITQVRVLNAQPGTTFELPDVRQEGGEPDGNAATGNPSAEGRVKRKPVRDGGGGSGSGAMGEDMESPVVGHLAAGESRSMGQPGGFVPFSSSRSVEEGAPVASFDNGGRRGITRSDTIAAASPGEEIPTPSPFLSPDAENRDPLGSPSPNTMGQPSPMSGEGDEGNNAPRDTPKPAPP